MSQERFRLLDKDEAAKIGVAEEYMRDATFLVEFPAGGKPRLVGVDGGEPEDATFFRDWNWVPDELNKAYERGLENGRKRD